MKSLYTSTVTATGGRGNGTAKSGDGLVDLKIGTPKETGRQGRWLQPRAAFRRGLFQLLPRRHQVRGRQGAAAGDDRRRSRRDRQGDARPRAMTAAASRSAWRWTCTCPASTRRRPRRSPRKAHTVCPYSWSIRGNVDVTTTGRLIGLSGEIESRGCMAAPHFSCVTPRRRAIAFSFTRSDMTWPLTDRKVMTFDVVGTLIDFETGILDYVQARAKAAGVTLTDQRHPRSLCRGRGPPAPRNAAPALPLHDGADVPRDGGGAGTARFTIPTPRTSACRFRAGRPSRIRWRR